MSITCVSIWEKMLPKTTAEKLTVTRERPCLISVPGCGKTTPFSNSQEIPWGPLLQSTMRWWIWVQYPVQSCPIHLLRLNPAFSVKEVCPIWCLLHLLKYHDARFARHPRFRYVGFNTLMRQQANTRAGFYIRHGANTGISTDGLHAASQDDSPEWESMALFSTQSPCCSGSLHSSGYTSILDWLLCRVLGSDDAD